MAYLGKLAPAVGGGLGGLPERKDTESSTVGLYGNILKRVILTNVSGNVTQNVDFTQFKDLNRVSVRVVLKSRSYGAIGINGDIFYFMGRGNDSVVSQSSYSGNYPNHKIDIIPPSNFVRWTTNSSYDIVDIIFTEWDFNYKLIQTASFGATASGYFNTANDISNIENVICSVWRYNYSTSDTAGAIFASGTYNFSGYYPSASDVADISIAGSAYTDYNRGLFLTFVSKNELYYRSFYGAYSPTINIFEILI